MTIILLDFRKLDWLGDCKSPGYRIYTGGYTSQLYKQDSNKPIQNIPLNRPVYWNVGS